MKAVIQRVDWASVSVDGVLYNEIGRGLLVYLGIGRDDSATTITPLVNKICQMRLFAEGERECVHSVTDIGGEILLVSQFTLYGDVRKGRRPSFSEAMDSGSAKILYEQTLLAFNESGLKTKGGVFGAMMAIDSCNNGPYTILLEIG